MRQLENTCRWITVMASGREVHIDDLPPELLEPAPGKRPGRQLGAGFAPVGRPGPRARPVELAGYRRAGVRADHDRDRPPAAATAVLLGWGRRYMTRKIKERV